MHPKGHLAIIPIVQHSSALFQQQDHTPLLVLIDGSSLAYRAFFAFQKNPLRNSRGENTSAVFAFTNSVLKLLRDYRPTYGAVVFDAKGPTFRHELYQEYKADRPKAPDELVRQLHIIREVAKGLGFQVLELPGYEADDLLATLAKRAEAQGFQVLILTSDKDLLQIVSDRIHVLDTRPKKDVYYTPETVLERKGVHPHQIPDLLALEGDAIDNIPGVPGVGEKTARALIQQFGSVEALLQHIDDVPRKSLRELLKNSNIQKQIVDSKTLATLESQAPVDISIEELKIRPMDRKILFPIFRDLEFASLMAQLAVVPKDLSEVSPPDTWPERVVATTLNGEGIIAIDETRFCRIPEPKIRDLLTTPTHQISAFALKPLHRWALQRQIHLTRPVFDLHLAAYLIDPGKSRYDLEYLAMETLGWKLHSDPVKQKAQEVLLVQRLQADYEARLAALGLEHLYREVEIPLSRVLARMEHRGVRVNPDHLTQLESSIQKHLQRLIQEIFDLAGEEFNLNSPRQLSRILFEKLGLPPVKKTQKGYSTDQETLQKLRDLHPLPAKILEYRELYKLLSTYIAPLRDWIGADGRIHPTFDQTGTATGRLSCKNPNLQNIPIRGDIGRQVRAAFEAAPGYVLLSADYSQIELRILAHLSGDETLRAAFLEGRDIHAETARRVFGDETERRRAKIVNFGIAYGMSAYGLSQQLGVSVREAERFIQGYFFSYPGVKAWIEETLAQARETGMVRTMLGRIRYVPEINSPNRQVREMYERIAVNSPIQGSAADMIKIAMIRIDERFQAERLRSGLILQIHDELLVEVAEDEVERAREIVVQEMEQALPLDVPVEVEVGMGKTWLEAHP